MQDQLKEWDNKFGCKHKKHLEYCNFCQMRVFIQKLIFQVQTKQRTGQQNRALYKFLTMLAESLNLAGKDMRVVLEPTYFIPWNKTSAHDHLWVPIQKAMFGTQSTRQLEKQGQIDKIHEVIMREMGEHHGIEYIPWPSHKVGYWDSAPMIGEEISYSK